MTYGFFRYCGDCAVLWQGPTNSTCWLCGEPGTERNDDDDFVYTATSMNGMTSEL